MLTKIEISDNIIYGIKFYLEVKVMGSVLDIIMNLFQGLDLEKVLGSITGVAGNHDLGAIVGLITDFFGGLFN